jgi:hypothetical protein
MIVLDGHKSHLSAQFEEFCKEKNIITLCLPTYSSHLTQPLDIDCFSILKQSYSKQFEAFTKTHVNYIAKPEFFIAFKVAHLAIMTTENIKVGFRSVGLLPYDPYCTNSSLNQVRTLHQVRPNVVCTCLRRPVLGPRSLTWPVLAMLA